MIWGISCLKAIELKGFQHVYRLGGLFKKKDLSSYTVIIQDVLLMPLSEMMSKIVLEKCSSQEYSKTWFLCLQIKCGASDVKLVNVDASLSCLRINAVKNAWKKKQINLHYFSTTPLLSEA